MSNIPRKPMLANNGVDKDRSKIDDLPWPMLAEPKYDGIRCMFYRGQAWSRSLILLPNLALQAMAANIPNKYEDVAIDGELCIGDPTAEGCFNRTQSIIMAHNKPIDGLIFHLFDLYPREGPRASAYDLGTVVSDLTLSVGRAQHPEFVKVETIVVHSKEELLKFEKQNKDAGHEGTILRIPDGPYKHGRSTMKEAYLLKLKGYEDTEAEIIGFEEQMQNTNEKVKNNLGRSKRSTHKDNMVPKGTLGAIRCKTKDGIEFAIGTGLDDDTRARIWSQRSQLLGKDVKYSFMAHGSKTAPRHPVFIAIID